MSQTNSNFIPASTGLSLGNQNQQWDTYLRNQTVTGTSTLTGTTTAGTLNAARFENIRYADQFGTIAAALADITGPGVVYVPGGYTEVITATISLSSKSLIIDPGANISFGVNGQIIVATDGVLDARGVTLTTSWTVGNCIQINSGRARVDIGRLIGPSSGTGNGLCFDGCSFNEAHVGQISGFGGAGVLFNCVGVSSICDNNLLFVGQVFQNGSGIVLTNQHGPGDSEVQGNEIHAGLVDNNTNAEIQIGDSGTFNAPAGSAQYNTIFANADGSASGAGGHAGVIFLNCSYNTYQGFAIAATPTYFVCTNSFLNTIISPAANLADLNAGQSQTWVTRAGIQTPSGLMLTNGVVLRWYNTAGVLKSVLSLDALDNVVMYGETTARTIAFQPTFGVNTMALDGATTSMKLFGRISEYNSVATAGGGVAYEAAVVNRTAQTAAITTTILYACPTSGQFRVSWNAKITTAATTGAATSTLGPLTIAYTDPDGVGVSITTAAIIVAGTVATSSAANTTGTVLLGIDQLLNCKGGTNVTYAFGYASNTAAQMAYNLHIVLETL